MERLLLYYHYQHEGVVGSRIEKDILLILIDKIGKDKGGREVIGHTSAPCIFYLFIFIY